MLPAAYPTTPLCSHFANCCPFFCISPCSEFAKLGLTRSVGGVLALALARELTPVVTSIIIAGRVGSAFAAELGTMQVGRWHAGGMQVGRRHKVAMVGRWLCRSHAGGQVACRWHAGGMK